MRVPGSPSAVFGAAFDLVLPAECVGCSQPGWQFCPDCQHELLKSAWEQAVQWSPSPVPEGFPTTVAAASYAGVVRKVLVAWKDGDSPSLARKLKPLLRQSLAGACELLEPASNSPLLVVPAPSNPRTVRTRGYRPVAHLCRDVVRDLPSQLAPDVLEVLVLHAGVADQARLSRAERAANLQGAMKLRSRRTEAVGGASVIVVDDVVTTGATLSQMKVNLLAGGARQVVAATVAATQRRLPPRPAQTALSEPEEAV